MSDQEEVFKEEDFTREIDLSELETILTKEQKHKCYEVVVEVAKYLKTDREKLYMIERLLMEFDNSVVSETFMNSVKAARKNLILEKEEKLIKPVKKGLIL